MKFIYYILRQALVITLLALCGCSRTPGANLCANDLEYVIDTYASGVDSLAQATSYRINLFIGSDNNYISAKLDTGSSQLIINEHSFVSGPHTQLGKTAYTFHNQNTSSLAINVLDSMQVGCSSVLDGRFALTSQNLPTDNIVGLAFGDPERLPHEANNLSFFDQLVKTNNFKDVISLALCAGRAPSHVLLGGIDDKMKHRIGNLVPITEKSSYVLPALTIRRADNKKVLGHFPMYDPLSQKGQKTILDSGTAFNLLAPEMAERVAQEIINRAKELGLYAGFPKGFFRTERAASLRTIKFNSLTQIRKFPNLEITFAGADGKVKALELSPLHYFKEMSTLDPLIRSFGFRETKGPIILGQPFLENHYIVLDRKNALVAFGDIDEVCTQ